MPWPEGMKLLVTSTKEALDRVEASYADADSSLIDQALDEVDETVDVMRTRTGKHYSAPPPPPPPPPPNGALVVPGTGKLIKADPCTDPNTVGVWGDVYPGGNSVVTLHTTGGDPHPDSSGNVNTGYRDIRAAQGVNRQQMGRNKVGTDFSRTFAGVNVAGGAAVGRIFYESFRLSAPRGADHQIWQWKHQESLGGSPCLSMVFNPDDNGGTIDFRCIPVLNGSIIWVLKGHRVQRNAWFRIATALVMSQDQNKGGISIWASMDPSNGFKKVAGPVRTNTVFRGDPTAVVTSGIYRHDDMPDSHMHVANAAVHEFNPAAL